MYRYICAYIVTSVHMPVFKSLQECRLTCTHDKVSCHSVLLSYCTVQLSSESVLAASMMQ